MIEDTPPVSLEDERKRRREGLSLLTTVPTPMCYPCAWEVIQKTRTVRCRKCGRAIDPWDAMWELARDFQSYQRNRDELRREVERLSAVRAEHKKRIEGLRAVERRLLKDTNVIAAQIADKLDALSIVQIRDKYQPMVAWISNWIRDGRWRLQSVKSPEPEGGPDDRAS